MAVYTPVTITGYNTSPPPDDGSTGTDNQLAWSKHKDKLGDPLKTAVEAINTNVSAAFSTNSTPVISVTHAIQSASSYMRSETYIDSGFSIAHNKLSTTSTLYIHTSIFVNFAFNFDSGSIQAYMKLANTSGTLITNTTDDIKIIFTDDVDHSSNPTWDNSFGVSRIWKILAADCPDGTSGTNTFDIWQKMNESDDGGVTFTNGTMMVWELEE